MYVSAKFEDNPSSGSHYAVIVGGGRGGVEDTKEKTRKKFLEKSFVRYLAKVIPGQSYI